MKNKKRATIGKISSELASKAPETRDPVELEKEMHKDYEANLIECVTIHKKIFPSDFYLIVETKKERLMENVLRNYFSARLSCPTPTYDIAVYKYHAKDEKIEFLWVTPSKDTCELLRDNALQVVPEERWLLDLILSFYDGTLLKRAKKLNGEEDLSPLLIK